MLRYAPSSLSLRALQEVLGFNVSYFNGGGTLAGLQAITGCTAPGEYNPQCGAEVSWKKRLACPSQEVRGGRVPAGWLTLLAVASMRPGSYLQETWTLHLMCMTQASVTIAPAVEKNIASRQLSLGKSGKPGFHIYHLCRCRMLRSSVSVMVV